MIRYTVIWDDRSSASSPTNDLARIWLDAPNGESKESINRAAHQLDVELREDAHAKGDPLSEGLRAITIPPLRFVFWVNEADRKAVVESVRAIASK
jgi:hypothetical protein